MKDNNWNDWTKPRLEVNIHDERTKYIMVFILVVILILSFFLGYYSGIGRGIELNAAACSEYINSTCFCGLIR